MSDVWAALFGNLHPIEVEVGAGVGTFVVPAAARHPRVNYFALERSRGRAARLAATAGARGLTNVRVLAADAACVISTIIPSASVSAYHIYFPDPWWKRRHHRRRLFTPHFAAALARTLVPAGRLYLATDVADTFALMLRTVEQCGAFVSIGATAVRLTATTFERKGLARGASIRNALFVRLGGSATLAHTSRAAPITPAESPS